MEGISYEAGEGYRRLCGFAAGGSGCRGGLRGAVEDMADESAAKSGGVFVTIVRVCRLRFWSHGCGWLYGWGGIRIDGLRVVGLVVVEEKSRRMLWHDGSDSSSSH